MQSWVICKISCLLSKKEFVQNLWCCFMQRWLLFDDQYLLLFIVISINRLHLIDGTALASIIFMSCFWYLDRSDFCDLLSEIFLFIWFESLIENIFTLKKGAKSLKESIPLRLFICVFCIFNRNSNVKWGQIVHCIIVGVARHYLETRSFYEISVIESLPVRTYHLI